MSAAFLSWSNSRPVSSLTGRMRKSLTAQWFIVSPTKRYFIVGRVDVEWLRSLSQSSRVIDKQPLRVNAPICANIIHSTYHCRKMHKWYLRLQLGMQKWNGLLLGGTGEAPEGGGGKRGREVMDSPTSCSRKVWLMAVHSAKHTSCEGR